MRELVPGELLDLDSKRAKQLLNEYSEYYENPDREFDFVTEIEKDWDSEKGSVSPQVIIKRRSDGKLFEGKYYKGGAGVRQYSGQYMHEVKAVEVKTIEYKRVTSWD
jgi:hypothetical protein